MDFQSWVSGGVDQLASLFKVGYAFGAGMVSAVNPCGFAMLPVYLSLYMGAENEQFADRHWGWRMLRAVGVTIVVTAGFGMLFGLIGFLVAFGGSFLMGIMPWLAIVIGALLIGLGLLMLFGKTLSFSLFSSLATKIGDPRNISIKGFFLFGLAFGATSLSCTLPIFLLVVGSAITSGSTAAGLLQFIWYILGAGAIFLSLTVGMALVKSGNVLRMLRNILPHVNKISAILLILAGLYIVYYWLTSGLLFV
ncbi:MAG: cytochrome c biogenesis protein CcdA [Desulfobulbaceae bacterium]|nr:MAG: cytochrome c biogenesis protein CcdA [Desulfobulbaceae bacterium]